MGLKLCVCICVFSCLPTGSSKWLNEPGEIKLDRVPGNSSEDFVCIWIHPSRFISLSQVSTFPTILALKFPSARAIRKRQLGGTRHNFPSDSCNLSFSPALYSTVCVALPIKDEYSQPGFSQFHTIFKLRRIEMLYNLNPPPSPAYE